MKIIVPGGSGQIGRFLVRSLTDLGNQVTVLTRTPRSENEAAWDGRNLGDWTRLIDGSDVVINLAGKSVNCRYSKANLDEMLHSRVDSTVAIGQAIELAKSPPHTWIQASTATIYAHTFGESNDERTGAIGGSEPDVPDYWNFSIKIAKEWEKATEAANTPKTRKVILRSAIVMSPSPGGAFHTLLALVRFGLGGNLAGGRQYISWIHDADFLRALQFLIQQNELDGIFNLSSPIPLQQKDFMKVLRDVWGIKLGLPATKLMLEIGAFFLRTDTELLLKSRRVVPGRLLQAGFNFEYPDWKKAAQELVARYRAKAFALSQ